MHTPRRVLEADWKFRIRAFTYPTIRLYRGANYLADCRNRHSTYLAITREHTSHIFIIYKFCKGLLSC